MDHSGIVSTDQTWALADSPHYITGDVTIQDGKTVTIEPGCVVLLCASGTSRILIYGSLIAEGTRSIPIRFRLNTVNDGIHQYFPKPKIITSSPSNAYSILIYANSYPSSFIHCLFDGLYYCIYPIAASKDYRTSLTIQYCMMANCRFPVGVGPASKARIDNCKLAGHYPMILGTGAEIHAYWCEFPPGYYLMSAFPTSKLYLYYCLINQLGTHIPTDSSNPLGQNAVGANIYYNNCFILTNSRNTIPLAHTLDNRPQYPTINEIRNSLIYIYGRILDSTAAVQLSSVYTSILSIANQYEGINGTDRYALNGGAYSQKLISQGDIIINCGTGILENKDLTATPIGGDSTNNPQMFLNSTRTDAEDERYFSDEIDNIAIGNVDEFTAAIEWETYTPSRSMLLLRREIDADYMLIEGDQSWSGREGDGYHMYNTGEWSQHALTISGLQPNTTYRFKIRGQNIAGTIFDEATENTFTTLGDARYITSQIRADIDRKETIRANVAKENTIRGIIRDV